MIMATKKDIFNEHKSTYFRADRQEKGRILAHVCFITDMHRKSVVRRFSELQRYDPWKEPGKPGRSLYYTPDVITALKEVWEAGNEVCGELLHPMIHEYVEILNRDKMWHHQDETTDKLLGMSQATVKRRVGTFMKARRRKKGLTVTRPSHLKRIVPIFTGPWSDKPPGWGQIDTVLNSNSSSGDAVYTLNYTDAATLLVIPRAQWNKGQEATRDGMKKIKEIMPFPWLGAHPDTGSEFINHFVVNWCKSEKIDFSRSRPNRKNDNMYVEERNGHVIRKTVGYITLNCLETVDALNGLYDLLTPYLMHFVAVRRMTEKEKLGSRYRRVYEKMAKTPYQMILEHPEVGTEIKEKLRQEHAKLNPLILKREIDKRVRNVYDIQKRFGKSQKDLS